MNKEQLSFAEVEQLLSELARHDAQAAALDDAQTELMRGAARGEIRRVFFRRHCLRVAGNMAALATLGGSFYLLQPEIGGGEEAEAQVASAQAPAASRAAASLAAAPALQRKTAVAPSASSALDHGSEICEVVIYSVPL